MMLQKKSNPWMRTKALYIIPVATLALSAFATPEFKTPVGALNGSSITSADKVTKSSAKNAMKIDKIVSTDLNPHHAEIIKLIRNNKHADEKYIYIVGGIMMKGAEFRNCPMYKIKNIMVLTDYAALKKLGYEEGKALVVCNYDYGTEGTGDEVVTTKFSGRKK